MSEVCSVETMNVMYYIWTSVQMLMEFSVIIITFPVLINELKYNKYLSTFKLYQWLITLFAAITSIVVRVWLIVFWENTVFLLLIYRLAMYCLFFFQFSIQMWWLMMIIYLKFLKTHRDSIPKHQGELVDNFEIIKRKIRRIEVIFRILFITYTFIFSGMILFLIFTEYSRSWSRQINKDNICKFAFNLSDWLNYVEEATQILFIITDGILFYFIIKTMKK